MRISDGELLINFIDDQGQGAYQPYSVVFKAMFPSVALFIVLAKHAASFGTKYTSISAINSQE